MPAQRRRTQRGAAGPLEVRVRDHVRATGWLRPGQRLVVAVSGGPDSVALLYLLRFAFADWDFRLVVAHFDHRMRPGSRADADWVRGLARAWEVPFRSGEADPPPASEAAARTARYAFLERVRRETGADRILTAHHADDQAETVLFRLIRGTGIGGLRGIAARRGPIVRPLLPFRRSEIDAYLVAARLRAREDPTNRLVHYARNRIRREIMPGLEAIAPGAAAAIARLAEHAAGDETAWRHALHRLLDDVVIGAREGAFELARPKLLSYHPQLRARLLRTLLRRLGSRPDSAGTRAALEFIISGSSGAEIRVSGGVAIEREFDTIRVRRAADAAPGGRDRPLTVQGPGPGRGEAVVGGVRFLVEWGPGRGAGEVFGLESLRFPLEFRGWRPGDRIRLGYGTKKLKKFFVERRIGRRERASLPVLAESDGQVLWVPGVVRAAVAESDAGPFFHLAVRHAE